MRYIDKTDPRGYKIRVAVRDGDEDNPEIGIPVGPPNLEEIDWEVLKKDINNGLFEQGLFTWQDVMKSQVGLNLIANVVKRHVVQLYRDYDNARKAQPKRNGKIR